MSHISNNSDFIAQRSIPELVELYQQEQTRLNDAQRIETCQAIRKEITRRLDALDSLGREQRQNREADEFEQWIAHALGTTPCSTTYALSRSSSILRYKDKLMDFTYMMLGEENFDDYYTPEVADRIEISRHCGVVIYLNIHRNRW